MQHLLLLVLAIGVKGVTITPGLTTTSGTELHKDVIGPVEQSNSQASKNRVARFGRKYGIILKVNEEAVTNENNFVRPCNFKDLQCIRKFFARNSKCKPVHGPVPDPFILQQYTEYLPYINLTVGFANFSAKGLSSAKVIEFYHNRKTSKVVFAIEVTNFNQSSPQAFYAYHRPARESIVLADYAFVVFKSVIFTSILSLPDMRLEFAEINGYVPGSDSIVETGPGVVSDDPQVKQAYSELQNSLPILIRERGLFQSQLYGALYIQKCICDFGVDLYAV